MEENNETKQEKECLDERILKEVETSMEDILDGGLSPDNLEMLSELVDIHKDITNERKEIFDMNYGNYGNYNGYGNSYGNYGEYNGRGPSNNAYGNYNGNYNGYGNYGRRGVDSRYRGEEHLDRMAGEYGRYQESRNRYGAGEETDKSFHYMVKALEDFIKVLEEEAETQQQKMQLKEALQKSMM